SDRVGPVSVRRGLPSSSSLPRAGLRLARLLDPQRARRWGEDALVAVIPLDAEPGRLLLQDLLDHSVPRRLRRSLGLDDHAVSDLRVHYSSLQTSTTSALVSSSRSAVARRTDCSCVPASSTTDGCSATRESTTTRSRPAPPKGGTAPRSNSG